MSLAAISIHYNPDVWPDPEKYNPERCISIPGSLQKISRNRFMAADDRAYAYIPFSAGPRKYASLLSALSRLTPFSCIGQVFAMNEMKSVVALTVRRFRLLPDHARKPIIEPAVVLRSSYVVCSSVPV